MQCQPRLVSHYCGLTNIASRFVLSCALIIGRRPENFWDNSTTNAKPFSITCHTITTMQTINDKQNANTSQNK
jgi:hypothetical protein